MASLRHLFFSTLLLMSVTATAYAATFMDAVKPEFANTRNPLVAAAVAEIPASEAVDVKTLGRALQEISHNEDEKVFAIFRWITTHIAYDADKLRTGFKRNLTASEVLEQGKAVCGGYAALFDALAKAMALRSHLIIGKAKGYGTDVLSHGWNAVQINGGWVLVDTTWGSGYLDEDMQFVQRYNEYYLNPPATELAYTHHPDDDDWQLVPQTLSFNEFLDRATLKPDFFRLGLGIRKMMFSNDYSRYFIELANVGHAMVAGHLLVNGREVEGNQVLISNDGPVSTLLVSFPTAGDYVLQLFAKPADVSGKYSQILEKELKVESGSPSSFPELTDVYLRSDAALLAPHQAELAAGSPVHFNIRIGKANRLAVINGKTWHWLQADADGRQFSATLTLKAGAARLVAEFDAGSNEFQSLAHYSVR